MHSGGLKIMKKKSEEEPIKTYGWVCPKCGKVNASFVRECLCNKKSKISIWPPPQPPWRIEAE